MKRVAIAERLPAKTILKRLAQGTVVIPNNRSRLLKTPCAIGSGLKTKINANLGTSTDRSLIKDELKKLRIACDYGADTVMDLSVGGDIAKIRRAILKHSPVPVGTVPVYEIAVRSQEKTGDISGFKAADMLRTLNEQAEEGVDFFTIHAGVTTKSLAALNRKKRLLGIVSRGGAILARWINVNRKENPFYEYFDDILDIASRHDVTLSLGDGLRPGSIFDASDAGQIAELKILGELCRRARKRKVQVMIEGPGHVPINRIKENIVMEKKLCDKAPFYVLGPLVTDIASGYDHISSAIGAALAASYGADFICYVTASEHLRLPSIEDVREAVVASKIAAHAADIAKGLKPAIEWDRKMSLARSKRDWKKQIGLSIDPRKAADYRDCSKPSAPDICTMCGKYCSIKLMEKRA